MNYDELKGGTKVYMYVPAMNGFYKMAVTAIHPEGFTISNYSLGKNWRIGGHEYLATIRSQEDLDNFFYLEKGKLTEESTIKAKEHFAKNNRSWIFSGNQFLMQTMTFN